MNNSEIQMLSDIALKVGRLEVLQESNAKAIQDMASSVNRLVDKLDKSDDIAREADQSARSAHHRIDEVADNQKWLWRTVVGALLLGAIGLLWKGVGH